MKKNRKGFTLVELLAVIVVLAIILAIAVPSITGIINGAKKNAFESNAKMIITAIEYKKLEDENFNPEDVTKATMQSLLGISGDNYSQVVVNVIDGKINLQLVGAEKFEGYTASGTREKIIVVETGEIDTIPPNVALIGDNPIIINVGSTYVDAGATALDDIDGDVTNSIILSGSVNTNVVDTYILTYTANDSSNNEGTIQRTVYVIKSDITFGGSDVDVSYGAVQTNDGGFVLVGRTTSNNGDITDGNNGSTDILVVKFSAIGAIEWDKTYGGSLNDFANSIINTSDGGFAVAGYTTSSNGDITDGNNGQEDIMLLKLNSIGELNWNKTYGGSQYDWAYSVVQTGDGGFAIAGSTYSNNGDITDGHNGNGDALIIKVSSTGVKEWDKTYGGSETETISQIIKTSDGGFALVGTTQSNNGDITDGNKGLRDFMLLKLNSTGTLSWNKTYGGSSNDYGNAIVQTSYGYVIFGDTQSNDGDITDGNNGNRDVLLIRTNLNGVK